MAGIALPTHTTFGSDSLQWLSMTVLKVLLRIAFIGALSLSGSVTLAADKPQRIVSLNLCTDELLLQLVEPERIASLTYLVANPARSRLASQAEGLHLNHGLAEEVIALNPDLVLTVQFSATAAVNLLRRLDRETVVLNFPATLEDSMAQIREVAALVGEEARGEALIAGMQANITEAQARLEARPHSAVFLASNGMAYGNATLRDTFLDSIGWNNVAAAQGIDGIAPLNLELLLAAEPDYLLVDRLDMDNERLARHLLSHPALAHYREQVRMINLPDALFQCAGPALAEAYALLAQSLTARELLP